jgi:hypothetical protein
MYKMATAGVHSGTILAVHLQKCSHLSNEITSDAKFFASQNLYDIFSDLHGKDSKTLICNISSEKKEEEKPCLPALKNFPILGETNNQFYLA